MKIKKTIFIAGGSGFLGRNLKEQLMGDYTILAPPHAELDLLDSERVRDYLRKHSFDIVIYCATHNATATSKVDRTLVLRNNLLMFFNVLRCHNLYGRMFYFGSGAEYDKTQNLHLVREEEFDRSVPKDDYGFSKYICSLAIERTPNVYNLRLFGCFGKYEDWRVRFISHAICQSLYGLDITIWQNIFFDYLYIDDLVKIIRWFTEQKNLKFRYYNICTANPIDLLTLAKKVVAISEKKLKIKVEESGLKQEYTGDNTRLLCEMNGFSLTLIDLAIKELYRWYEEHESIVDKSQL